MIPLWSGKIANFYQTCSGRFRMISWNSCLLRNFLCILYFLALKCSGKGSIPHIIWGWNNLAVGILIKTRKSPWMKAERTAPRPLVFEIKWKFWGFTKCCQKPELHKNHWAKVREKHESVSGDRIGHVYHLLLHHLMFVTIFWSKVCSFYFYLETQWLESSVEILVINAFCKD